MHANTEVQTSTTLLNRLNGAMRLKRITLEEIGTDSHAFPQVLTVVALAAVANGITETRETGLGPIAGAMALIIGWLAISVACWLLASMFNPDDQTLTFTRILAILGFACAPVILLPLSQLPGIGWILTLFIQLWAFAAMVVAISVAIRVSIGKAILSSIIGGIPAGIAILLFTAPFR